MPKFDGRLKLASMEKNTGSGSLPRNKGLLLSRGEYIFNMDNDDALTNTALEEMYTLAKEYDADVVYCEQYYEADANLETRSLTTWNKKAPLVNTPTIETSLLSERLDRLTSFWVTPWTKLIKRKLLIEHQIFFPNIIRDDSIWTWDLVFWSKIFLRVPNAVYIWRNTPTSITRRDRDPRDVINFWLNPVILGVKYLDERLKQVEFFQKNPQKYYDLLIFFIQDSFKHHIFIEARQQLNSYDIFKAVQEKFSENLGEYDVLIPALCSIITHEQSSKDKIAREFRKLQNIFTARIDIWLIPNSEQGDIQFVSTSDDNTSIGRATWVEDKIVYFVQSYAGKLDLVAKATSDGRFDVILRGKDVRDPADRSKRIPYWIDYTKLTINGKVIIDKPTSVWHDKSYKYSLDVKTDEGIVIQAEWLPHINH